MQITPSASAPGPGSPPCKVLFSNRNHTAVVPLRVAVPTGLLGLLHTPKDIRSVSWPSHSPPVAQPWRYRVAGKYGRGVRGSGGQPRGASGVPQLFGSGGPGG